MQHILQKSREELERTHRLVNEYKDTGFSEIIHSFLWKSFKSVLIKYVYKKEEILMNYSSLFSDITKDISDPSENAVDLPYVRKSIEFITKAIEDCGNLLETLISHSKRQEEIVEHEKIFFVQLLESFNNDMVQWVSAHEKKFFGEVSKLEWTHSITSLQAWKNLLELQKKRLESHIKNIQK